MSGSKAALKAINDAIKQRKFDDAIEQAETFLRKDPKSFQGCVRPVLSLTPRHHCQLTRHLIQLHIPRLCS